MAHHKEANPHFTEPQPWHQDPHVLPRHGQPARPPPESQHAPPPHQVLPPKSPQVQRPHLELPPESRSQQARPPPSPQVLPPRGLPVRPNRTKFYTWSAAVFCAMFWIIVILGGLIVLIIYLVYRPQSPRFNVSSVTLNAAYLDMGYLLNADVTVLTNFTNPNKKVSVDFSYLIIELFYGGTLLATRYIEPFSEKRGESMFANVHMVSSQVPLSVKYGQRLTRQMERNRVGFEVRGLFRARSNLGGFLRYSYWLYGHCNVVVTAPPSGVLLASKCRTKR